MRPALAEGDPPPNSPIRAAFACCAHADEHGAWSMEQGANGKEQRRLSAKSVALTRIADLQFRIADFNPFPERQPVRMPFVLILLLVKFEIRNSKSEIRVIESPYLPAPTHSAKS